MRTYPPAPTRFEERVEVLDTGCWFWAGAKTHNGYGVFNDGGWVRAHRWAYEHFIAPIPSELTIDHLCRIPSCVNPTHLEPVTVRENTLRSPVAPTAVNARKTHCKRGHPFDQMNTLVRLTGRGCKTCLRERKRITYPIWRAKRRAAREIVS
jgi:hypothetical protein